MSTPFTPRPLTETKLNALIHRHHRLFMRDYKRSIRGMAEILRHIGVEDLGTPMITDQQKVLAKLQAGRHHHHTEEGLVSSMAHHCGTVTALCRLLKVRLRVPR
jgi:LytS/YehU family sensor histidine kinase